MKSYLQFIREGVSADGGLYSFRKLNLFSTEFLTEWMQENRIPNPVPSSELHCTVVCSETSIPQYQPDTALVMLNPATYRIQMLGEALVVGFSSDLLHRQWLTANALGAQNRWPTFNPHITVSYKVPLRFAIEELKPPPVGLVLDVEQCRDMVDGWASVNSLKEDVGTAQMYAPQASLSMDREKMPQIAGDDIGEFVSWLEAKGVSVSWEKTPASTLRSAQREINLDKVSALSASLPEKALSKPLIVSNDDYILDGHHRWLAITNRDPHYKINTYRVDLPISQLLSLTDKFPKTFYKGIHEDTYQLA